MKTVLGMAVLLISLAQQTTPATLENVHFLSGFAAIFAEVQYLPE
jgi:hypothetical protein